MKIIPASGKILIPKSNNCEARHEEGEPCIKTRKSITHTFNKLLYIEVSTCVLVTCRSMCTWEFFFRIQILFRNRLTRNTKQAINNFSFLFLDVSCKVGSVQSRQKIQKLLYLKGLNDSFNGISATLCN